MTKYSKAQLLEIAETAPEKLNEIVALAMGWTKRYMKGYATTSGAGRPSYFIWSDKNGEDMSTSDIYTPTTNDAQAFALMVKYEICLQPLDFDYDVREIIVIDSILAAQEEK